MGILSLIIVILLKVALLSSISAPLRLNALVLMCVLSRWAMVFSIFTFPYARREGKAKAYTQGISPGIFLRATVITLFIIFFSRSFKGLLIWAVTAGAAYLLNRHINNKISGLTGDTIGAVNEITETLALFCFMF
jgi:adenosylcobinamide-GDP ribazoletransferase